MIFGLAKILRPKEFLRAKYLRSQLSGAVEQFNLMRQVTARLILAGHLCQAHPDDLIGRAVAGGDIFLTRLFLHCRNNASFGSWFRQIVVAVYRPQRMDANSTGLVCNST